MPVNLFFRYVGFEGAKLAADAELPSGAWLGTVLLPGYFPNTEKIPTSLLWRGAASDVTSRSLLWIFPSLVKCYRDQAVDAADEDADRE
jgi:hypothetical protein